MAGPCKVNIRKPLSQEASLLLRQQHPGAGCLGDSFLGFTIFASLRPWELQTPALAHCFPFLPSPKPGTEAPGPAGLCVSLPSARPRSQARAWASASASAAQPSTPASASLHRCPTRVLFHSCMAAVLKGGRKSGATQSPPRPSRPEWW